MNYYIKKKIRAYLNSLRAFMKCHNLARVIIRATALLWFDRFLSEKLKCAFRRCTPKNAKNMTYVSTKGKIAH